MALRLVSFLMHLGNILYWYCDIIDYEKEFDKITFIDLLADVKVFEDGRIEILDLDELKEALEIGLIDNKRFLDAINKLNKLLRLINEKKGIENLINYLIKASE